MTSFTYYSNIPNAPDNPSFDQPLMQINSQSINSLMAVDHVTFNTTGPTAPSAGQSGGQHLQVTFNSKNVPGGAPTDPVSIMYTNSGTASSVSEVFYRNQNAIYQAMPIKAWGYANSAGIISSQSSNVTSAVRNSLGNYTVTLSANAVSSSNFAVIVNCTLSTDNFFIFAAYSITGTGTFNLLFGRNDIGFKDPTSYSFIVIQI